MWAIGRWMAYVTAQKGFGPYGVGMAILEVCNVASRKAHAMEFFATCPTGFESLLADELKRLGMERVRPLQGRVSFEGAARDAYVACLWSRLASRVIVVLSRVYATNSDKLYESVHALAWENELRGGASFAIDATGTNAELRTSQFVAQRCKDAIVDRMREKTGLRPSVDAKSPDLRIVVNLSGMRAMVGIDLAGAPLFHRGYERPGKGLRPDYAAALLELGGWSQAPNGSTLLAVHDGQGTLLAEAALMAGGRAPGLLRGKWGFEGWGQHDEAAWNACRADAEAAIVEHPAARFFALEGGIATPKSTLRAAGVEVDVQVVSPEELASMGTPELLACDLCGFEADDLAAESVAVSALVGAVATTLPRHVAVFSRDGLPAIVLRENPARTVRTRLGREDARLVAFDAPEALAEPALGIELPEGASLLPLVPTSDQFAARLRKVARLRSRWARREGITCYRVYDADLPDYALSIDLFEGTNPTTLMPTGKKWLYVSEYAPPKEIDAALARCRFLDALAISSAVLGVAPENVHTRLRRHAKGGSQYAEEGKRGAVSDKDPTRKKGANTWGSMPAGAHIVDEGGLLFEVNFSSRLDCGIFLDHRETRSMLREMAKQTKGSKRFLNLFAYTGTATCYAADGGMIHTTTVDLSRPSLDWARRNMARNGFTGSEHEFVQADALRWIGEQRHSPNRWDLVFCDVPTFSNSRRMRGRSFDVQRDHIELLINLSRLLTRNGVCVFSCNLRTFKPNVEMLERARVQLEDVTEQTIPEDFARNQRVHHTFLVRRI